MIKRYDIYPAHDMELDIEECKDGSWIKYEDIKHLIECSHNSDYAVPDSPAPKSCAGCKYEPEEMCTAECLRHKYTDMYKSA